MSVIHKALSNIEAAEGAHPTQPVAAGVAGTRSGRRFDAKMMVGGTVIAAALFSAVMVVTGPGSLFPAFGELMTAVTARSGDPGTSSSAVDPVSAQRRAAKGNHDTEPAESPGRGGRQGSIQDASTAAVWEKRDAGPARHAPSARRHSPSVAMRVASSARPRYVFEPARGAREPRSAAPSLAEAERSDGREARQAVAAGNSSPASRLTRPARHDVAASTAVKAARDSDGSPQVKAEDHTVDHVTVTQDNTRRIRLLSTDLNGAVQRRDADAINEILQKMETLAGPGSTYMLKVRAFTQLALGGHNKQAMRLLHRVLAREPDDRDAAFNMAVAEINEGRLDDARSRLETLAVDHPGDRQIRKLLRSIQ